MEDIMPILRLSEDSGSEEVLPFAMMVHELLSLPVTMRSSIVKVSGLKMEKSWIMTIPDLYLKSFI